jgi:tripartite-type tricarboxylate transporter receptor subunit TctC
MNRNFIGLLFGLLLLAAPAWGQPWPGRPIKLIAPYPPAGLVDVLSRYLAEKLSGALGQQVVVDNKPGAGGILGAEFVKNSPADGYTFLHVTSSMMCINPFVYKRLPYDRLNDFVPVTQLGSAPLVMVVPPSLGVASLGEFVNHARAHKGKTSFASFGTGSSSHVWGEMLSQADKLEMTHVPYKGAAPAIQDVLGGHIAMTIQDLAISTPLISSGKLIPLAVTSSERWPRLPNVPTFGELGYKISLSGWNAIMAPAGTPRDVVDRMSAEIQKLVRSPEGSQRLLEMGLFPTGTGAAELAEIMQASCGEWGEAVKNAGVQPE